MEPTSNALIRLSQSGIDEAIQILAGAFNGDPLMDYLFPDREEQPEQLNHFFRANLQHALIVGEIYLSSPSAGVAVWLFPGDVERPVIPRQDDPRLRLRDILGEHTYVRLRRFTQFTNKLHREVLQGSYCYLMFLGVEKRQQGKGTGSLLIKPMLARADEKRLPCLLDTITAKNVAFYTKRNFEVISETKVCGDGPHAWIMIRHPQP